MLRVSPPARQPGGRLSGDLPVRPLTRPGPEGVPGGAHTHEPHGRVAEARGVSAHGSHRPPPCQGQAQVGVIPGAPRRFYEARVALWPPALALHCPAPLSVHPPREVAADPRAGLKPGRPARQSGHLTFRYQPRKCAGTKPSSLSCRGRDAGLAQPPYHIPVTPCGPQQPCLGPGRVMSLRGPGSPLAPCAHSGWLPPKPRAPEHPTGLSGTRPGLAHMLWVDDTA